MKSPWFRCAPTFRTASTSATSQALRSSQNTTPQYCASRPPETAHAVRLRGYALTRIVCVPVQEMIWYLKRIICQAVVLLLHCLFLLFVFFFFLQPAPGAVGHLSFTDILDTSLKVSWKEPQEKNGVLTGNH